MLNKAIIYQVPDFRKNSLAWLKAETCSLKKDSKNEPYSISKNTFSFQHVQAHYLWFSKTVCNMLPLIYPVFDTALLM